VTELAIRPLVEDEEHLFESLPDSGLVGQAAFGRSYRALAAQGEYRPHLTWVALRGDDVVARAAWRATTHAGQPPALDWFDFIDFEAGVRLLRAAPMATQYHLALPPGWRNSPSTADAANARIGAARVAGLLPLVERYGYRWTPDRGLPDRPGRLVFRPEADDAVVLDTFRRIHHGTLDAHARRAAGDKGPEAAARKDLDIVNRMPRAREWLRLAYTPEGEPVGLMTTSWFREPLAGFAGVLPEHRGNGYSYDLLVEMMHLLVAEGAETIIGNADTTNHPMVSALARAGWPIVELRIHLA